jgi:glycine C-acetyltransferase|tara:strand:+ start:5040 stop:6452 length:1413 start_codon:yes stop_codon:yes gene_type:complete
MEKLNGNTIIEQEVEQSFTLADFINFPEKDIMDRAREFRQFSKYIDQHKHNTVQRVSYSSSTPIRLVKDNYTGEMRNMIYMASNDYLNLSSHPKVKQAGIDAIHKYGTGSGSAPLIGGTTNSHVELEQKIAKFKGCESAMVYSSGYGSNISTLLSMLDKSDLAIVDELAHASLIDGCKNTNLKFFRHNDTDYLETILMRFSNDFRTKLIIIDGVYSMDGDIAKLDKIVPLAKKYGAYLMLDEAHATGVLGETGSGTAEHFNLKGQIDIVCGTFSKSLGGVGGFVASNAELINLLRFYSRGYMFSASMTPPTAAAISAAIDIIKSEPERRERLWRNIKYFKRKLLELGFNIGQSETAIFPIIIGDDFIVKEMCRDLNDLNIYVNPVIYPAVPRKSSRLRLSLMADHSQKHLDKVLKALEELGKKYKVIKGESEREKWEVLMPDVTKNNKLPKYSNHEKHADRKRNFSLVQY